jgi:hypothetical protein
MNIIKYPHSTFLSFMIIAIMFTGCTVSTSEVNTLPRGVPEPNPSVTEVPQRNPAATVSPFLKESPKNTQTKFITPIISLTPTPAQMPSLTPKPTLSEIESKGEVIGLLSTNGNCLFPCFWGIMPGKSSWAETKNILLSISSNINSFALPGAPEVEGVDWEYRLPNEKKFEDGIRQRYFVEDDKILIISPSRPHGESASPEAIDRYTLNKILKDFGEPEEILIQTYSATPDKSHPFNVLIIYPHRGIMINYRQEGQQSGNKISTCIIDNPS